MHSYRRVEEKNIKWRLQPLRKLGERELNFHPIVGSSATRQLDGTRIDICGSVNVARPKQHGQMRNYSARALPRRLSSA